MMNLAMLHSQMIYFRWECLAHILTIKLQKVIGPYILWQWGERLGACLFEMTANWEHTSYLCIVIPFVTMHIGATCLYCHLKYRNPGTGARDINRCFLQVYDFYESGCVHLYLWKYKMNRFVQRHLFRILFPKCLFICLWSSHFISRSLSFIIHKYWSKCNIYPKVDNSGGVPIQIHVCNIPEAGMMHICHCKCS